ncbi:MAG: DUF302 domain-containing protein [Mariprofundaceae bacterium]
MGSMMILSLLILACCLALALIFMASMRIKKEGLTFTGEAERQHFKRSVEDVQRQHSREQISMAGSDDSVSGDIIYTKSGFGKRLDMSVDEAVGAVNKALSANGFKVLSDTDVTKVINRSAMAPCRMLAVCHSVLAGKAIDVEPHLGVVSSDIVIRQDLSDEVHVEISDPTLASGLSKYPELGELGSKLKAQLIRVLQAV